MQKALSRNPNLLRTLLGLSVTLIIVLGYSIYSASIESEYYHYHTEMEESSIILNLDNDTADDNMLWTSSSSGSLTWVNITITGAPEGSTLTITSGGSKWWSHPLLGDVDAENFNCLEPNSDFEMVNHCDYGFTHSIVIDDSGSTTIRGLLSDELPLSSLGTIRADNLSAAEDESLSILERANISVTWQLELSNDAAIDKEAVDLDVTIVSNTLNGVEKFQLNPFVESIWSLTALMSCFVMALALPLGIYYASIKREQRLNRLRNEFDESE
ncbi:MAG: hypothetical protein QF807_01375 [Candidatus Thalassarchaeaceae archaeon]|nr:hypothetical protein [Candidatus Thalassarchaeaceae archaeon]MDP7042654.1 hypothetical protein [Candidatus Thalassarchaeaceae archaeon]